MNINDQVKEILDKEVREGREIGVQFAVYRRGECVVDAFAGNAAEGGAPVTSSTLFPVFSTTKGITATVIHRLADRGLIDYDAPVCRYWSDFARNGKENICVRHVLTHSSGMENMPNTLTIEEMADFDTIAGIIAEQPASSRPSERIAYHAVTFGTILGKIACIVTGKTFPELVKSEICGITGDNNVYCGYSGEQSAVATLYEPNWDRAMITELAFAPIPNCAVPLHEMMNMPKGRASSMPGSSGIMSAKAIAAHYSALTPFGANGKRFFGDARLAEVIRLFVPETPSTERRCLGYELFSGTQATIGHGGYGGSSGFADTESGVAVGFTRNLFSANDLLERLKRLVL